MKKALLVLFALSFVMGTVAMATETRVTTMGENNETLKDEHNIWLYPSTINSYPNMVTGLVSEGEFGKAGGHWTFGKAVVGLYMDNSDYFIYYNDFDKATRSVDSRINLFYGRQLGEMPFGLRLSLWGNGDRREDTPLDTGNYDDSYSRFEAALGLTAMEGKLDIAAGIGMSSFTEERNISHPFEDAYLTYDNLATDGSFDFDLRARYWHEFDEKWTLIPHGSFSSMSTTVIDQDLDTEDDEFAFYDRYEYEDSGSMINLGLGTNYQASERVMTVTDLGVWFATYTEEATEHPSPYAAAGTEDFVYTNEYKPTAVPYIKAGLEGEVKDWLDVRIGMVSEWYSDESTREQSNLPNEDFSSTEYGVSTRTYLGTGFHFGDLHIDTELNASFLNDGPYFITGRPNDYYSYSGWWATQVAIRYDFN